MRTPFVLPKGDGLTVDSRNITVMATILFNHIRNIRPILGPQRASFTPPTSAPERAGADEIDVELAGLARDEQFAE
jgi:hypothetical protein